MKLEDKDVKYTANLAKLELKENESNKMKESLSQILDYIGMLDEIDTSKVKPLSHILPIENVFREDKVKEGLTIEKALENAPSKSERCFKVPKML